MGNISFLNTNILASYIDYFSVLIQAKKIVRNISLFVPLCWLQSILISEWSCISSSLHVEYFNPHSL